MSLKTWSAALDVINEIKSGRSFSFNGMTFPTSCLIVREDSVLVSYGRQRHFILDQFDDSLSNPLVALSPSEIKDYLRSIIGSV